MRRKNWAIPGLLVLAILLLLSFPGIALADESNTPAAQETEVSTNQSDPAQEVGGDTGVQQDTESVGSNAKEESVPAAEPEKPVSEDSGKAEDTPAAEPEKPVSEDSGKAEDTPAGEPEKPVSEDSGKAEDTPAAEPEKPVSEDSGKAEDTPAGEPEKPVSEDSGKAEDTPAGEPEKPVSEDSGKAGDTPAAEPEKPASEDSGEAGDKPSDSDTSDKGDEQTGPVDQTPKPVPVIVVPKDTMGQQDNNGSVVVQDPETGQYLPGYVVKPGDTVETISKKTGVPVDDLKKANGLDVADNEAAVPSTQTSSVSTDAPSTDGSQEEKDAGPYVTYKVRKGESLWLIGRSMGIPYEDIMAANNLTSHLIYPDQELIIPGIKPEGGMFRYRVKPGDTFYLIARALALDYNDIMSLNGFDEIWIYPGDELVIPDLKEVDLYRVQEGETLSDIAGKFRIIEKQIYGHEISGGKLAEGQVLVIPQDAAVNVNVQVETSNTNLMDASELELLARAIYGEARGEVYEGKVAVGAVIMNRLKDPAFPKTIKDIIFQPRAFTAVDDGQINLTPDAESYRAAREAMNGADPTLGAVYYWNPEIATSKWIWTRPIIKQIGNHVFAK